MAVPSDSEEATPVLAIRGSTRGALNVFPFLRSTVPIRERNHLPTRPLIKNALPKNHRQGVFLWVSLTGCYESTIFFSPA